MTLCFQADADLDQIILHAVIRREPTLDFQTAEAAGLMGLHDPEVLALATREGRVLVTHDQKATPETFCRVHHHRDKPRCADYSAEVARFSAAEDLLLIWSTMYAEDRIHGLSRAVSHESIAHDELLRATPRLPFGSGRVVVGLEVGGFHHHFDRQAASVREPCP